MIASASVVISGPIRGGESCYNCRYAREESIQSVLISILETFLLMAISIASGILGTVTGGGGGTFTVPALVSTVNESPQVLVGSVFLMYLVSSVTGLFVYYRKGLVDLRAGMLLSIPAVPGVLLGTLLSTSISGVTFKVALGSLVVVLGMLMFLRPAGFGYEVPSAPRGSSHDSSLEEEEDDVDERRNSSSRRTLVDQSGRVFEYTPNFPVGMLATFAAGILNGVFGAGASIIIIPATILFVRLPGHVAIASTRIVLTSLNTTALLAHIGTGLINIYYAILLAIGAVIGSIIGARIAFWASKTTLSKLIALVFLAIGIYLMISVA